MYMNANQKKIASYFFCPEQYFLINYASTVYFFFLFLHNKLPWLIHLSEFLKENMKEKIKATLQTLHILLYGL